MTLERFRHGLGSKIDRINKKKAISIVKDNRDN